MINKKIFIENFWPKISFALSFTAFSFQMFVLNPSQKKIHNQLYLIETKIDNFNKKIDDLNKKN